MLIFSQDEQGLNITELGFDRLLNKGSSSSNADYLTPELRNLFSEGISAKSIISGELAAALEQVQEALKSGKTAFSITQPGYILGIDPADGLAKFYLGNSTNYMFFDGNTLQITGGTVVGDVGGFIVTANALTGGALVLDSSANRITWGTANDVMIADADDATYRLWIGNATAASAPFSVTKAGVTLVTQITATSIIIGANTITTSEWANLDGLNQTVATGSSPTFVNLTITSLIIGANTITTSEWANLDGLNQTVATGSSPTFVNLTVTTIIIGANTISTTEWANLDGLNQTVATGSSPTFAGLTVSGLTSGRVVIAGASGVLGGDADLTFSGDTLTGTKLKVGGAAGFISSDGSAGATGTIDTATSQVITVKDGIITSIV